MYKKAVVPSATCLQRQLYHLAGESLWKCIAMLTWGPSGKKLCRVHQIHILRWHMSDIAIDLSQIPGINHLIIVVDNYSCLLEVVLFAKTDAAHGDYSVFC